MGTLASNQIEVIKSHMMDDKSLLEKRFKAINSTFETSKILHSEREAYEKLGFHFKEASAKKVTMVREKSPSDQLEDDIWCMFYKLGFKILNKDRNLEVQWGPNKQDTQQLDVVAVGEDAIFVVECKAAVVPTSQPFKKDINLMGQYMEGVSYALRQIYGEEKRVKFIFATRKYRIKEKGEDSDRLKDYGIYHLDDNSFKYICNLITSYQESVVYQFYGLMFKDELINDKPITIPALKGQMGDQNYYLFSIEPSTLLKIGFVLHRTKVNDSMAPTYQRLLVPKRLKGITKFIDEGGYFPNSIIINFSKPNENLKVTFDHIHKENSSNAEFGLLNIPNAYGIAYIIDGQHRVYGYANSKFKDKHTIPAVAFDNMPSEEQLKIFMEINENQKSVSKNLKIDLQEDLYWKEENLELRMRALRSAVIKQLGLLPESVLYGKITIGEDKAELSSDNFNSGLIRSGLIPTAKKTKWIGNTDTCLYDIAETNVSNAMDLSRDSIYNFLNGCYEIADKEMDKDIKNLYLFSNRATFPFVALMGLLHSYLFNLGEISSTMSINERVACIEPYIKVLVKGLGSLPPEEDTYLRGIQGQGAEKKWLLSYQNIINQTYPDYCPTELIEYQEMKDKDIQDEGENLRNEIRSDLRVLVFERLKMVYGNNFEKSIAQIKNKCEGEIIRIHGNDDDFELDSYNWIDWIEITDYKEIVDKNYSDDHFSEVFGIALNEKDKSKKDKLSWFSIIDNPKGKKRNPLKKSDLNTLWLIRNHLNDFLQTEE